MNFVVELYDTELKATRVELRRSEKLVAAKDAFIRRKKAEWTEETDKLKASSVISRRKAQKEKLAAVETELGAAQETVGILETQITLMKETEEEMEKEQAKIIEQHEKKIKQQPMEIERLKRSRVFEVTKERVRVQTEMIAKCHRCFRSIADREKHMEPFDHANAMYNQAFRTRSCLEVLKEAGRDIPQDTVDMFSVREKDYDEKAKELDVGAIPETDLTLSPLVLPSEFVDERILAGLDTFGSNASLIDPNDAAALSRLVAEDSGSRSLDGEPSWAVVPNDDLSEIPISGQRSVDKKVVQDQTEKEPSILLVSDTSAKDQTDGPDDESAVEQRASSVRGQGDDADPQTVADVDPPTSMEPERKEEWKEFRMRAPGERGPEGRTEQAADDATKD